MTQFLLISRHPFPYDRHPFLQPSSPFRRHSRTIYFVHAQRGYEIIAFGNLFQYGARCQRSPNRLPVATLKRGRAMPFEDDGGRENDGDGWFVLPESAARDDV